MRHIVMFAVTALIVVGAVVIAIRTFGRRT